jgi:uncharacterized protein with FMN-binding domain
MVNTKVVVSLIALSVVVALIAGIAFSQFASAQANASRNVIGQTQQCAYGTYPQQGYYGSGQYGSPYGYGGGMGMGMCGRFW